MRHPGVWRNANGFSETDGDAFVADTGQLMPAAADDKLSLRASRLDNHDLGLEPGGASRGSIGTALGNGPPRHFVAHFAAKSGKHKTKCLKKWSERQDSNLRPLRPERSALPG
jgi:hypothetical protein